MATNVFLSGFRLIGSTGNTSQDAILLDSSGFTNSGVWYSEVRDLFITGFAGNGIHLVGTSANFSGISQWIEFNRVIVFRSRGGGNGLRIEGATYELYFNDCQFDGTAPGDGTNIFIGARPGNPYGIPIDINFRGLTSQNAATAVQIDGGWAVSFYSPHHEFVWGVYALTGDLGASIAGVTISDAGFQTSGVNNGAGYLLSVTNPGAFGVRFIHNNIMGPADAVVRASNGAGIVYKDNLFAGGTNLPVTSGITTQITPAATINIGGAHTVGLNASTTPITVIQSGLGPGETVTFISINGPVTFGVGGNINLLGESLFTVNGSITFVVSDLPTPSWVPISRWSVGQTVSSPEPLPLPPPDFRANSCFAGLRIPENPPPPSPHPPRNPALALPQLRRFFPTAAGCGWATRGSRIPSRHPLARLANFPLRFCSARTSFAVSRSHFKLSCNTQSVSEARYRR